MGSCRLSALLVLTVLLGLASCSGDNDPSGEPPTTSPPEPVETRPSTPEERDFPAEFAGRVDSICVRAQKQTDEITSGDFENRGSLRRLAGVYEDAAGELESLEPPSENAPAYRRFTDAFRDGSDLLRRLDAEVGRGDTSAFQRVTSILDQTNTEIEDLAREYGFEECATG